MALGDLMSLAAAGLDARVARRVTAAAIAVALQGVFYWLVLPEAVESTARPSSTSLEVILLQTVRPFELAVPSQVSRRRLRRGRRRQVEPMTEALPLSEVEKGRPAPQAAQPAVHTPIDWQQAMQGEVRAQESHPRRRKLQFGFPRRQPAVPEAPAFGWDYAHTHRLQALPGGGMLINLTDHCAIVLYGLLIPVCRIGRIPVNGHLFDHMHDRRNDRPGALP